MLAFIVLLGFMALLGTFAASGPKSTATVAQLLQKLKDGIQAEEAVVDIMKALCAMINGEQGDRARSMLVSLGGVDLLTMGIREHGESPKVVNACLSVLVSLLGNAEVKLRLQGDLDFMRTLVGVMKANLKALQRSSAQGSRNEAWECSVADVLRQSCLLIGACADGEGEVQDVCGSCGAVEAAIGSMKSFPRHADLQKWAAFALFNLTYDHAGNKVLLAGKGGLQVVISSMRAHVGSREVQRLAIATLYSVLQQRHSLEEAGYGSDDDDEEEEHEEGVRVGAMRAVALSNAMNEAVMEAAHAHRHDREIQSMAAQLLDVSRQAAEEVRPSRPRCDASRPLSQVAAF